MPVTRFHLSIFRGQAELELEWGCLVTRVDSFQGVPLPKGGRGFLRIGKGRGKCDENEILGSLESRKDTGYGDRNFSVFKISEQKDPEKAMFLMLPHPKSPMQWT